MEGLYPRVKACNLFVIASPIQFGTVSALTKAFVERFQCFWAAKYVLGRARIPASSGKELACILVSTLDRPKQFECASYVFQTLATVLNMGYGGHLGFSLLDGPGEVSRHPEWIDRVVAWGAELASRLGLVSPGLGAPGTRVERRRWRLGTGGRR